MRSPNASSTRNGEGSMPGVTIGLSPLVTKIHKKRIMANPINPKINRMVGLTSPVFPSNFIQEAFLYLAILVSYQLKLRSPVFSFAFFILILLATRNRFVWPIANDDKSVFIDPVFCGKIVCNCLRSLL